MCHLASTSGIVDSSLVGYAKMGWRRRSEVALMILAFLIIMADVLGVAHVI
jgi:hypothetical protein